MGELRGEEMIERGATPLHTFTVDEDCRLAEVIYITYVQHGRVVVEKTINDITVEEDTITVQLSQEDTLRFDESETRIQIRARFPGGRAIKSEVMLTEGDELLKTEVI